MADSSEHSQFIDRWDELPEVIRNQYSMEPDVDDFDRQQMAACDRLRERRREGRFARLVSWAGRGYSRRDGESTT